MKKYLLVLSIAAMAASCNDKPGSNENVSGKGGLSTDLVQNPRSANGIDTNALAKMATMDFADTMHDFGSVHEGEILQYDFRFKNNGKSPLVIGSAAGSCGCTVPEYPHEPIQPGQEGIMKVKFNTTDKTGYQEKSVTISSNANRGLRLLLIKAQVAAANNN